MSSTESTQTVTSWAIKAFKMIMWQVTFMPDTTHKKNVIKFLLDAPNEIKSGYWKEMK